MLCTSTVLLKSFRVSCKIVRSQNGQYRISGPIISVLTGYRYPVISGIGYIGPNYFPAVSGHVEVVIRLVYGLLGNWERIIPC